MKKRTILRADLLLAICLGAASHAFAQSFSSAHWKSSVSIEGGRQRGPGAADYEVWLKGGKMRMQTKATGAQMNMLKLGDEMYNWQEGGTAGMKMNLAMAQQVGGGSSSDYVTRAEEYRTKGKKVGTETIDGHPCEIYDYQDDARHTKGRYWLATDLDHFAVKAVIESGGSKTTIHNTDIQVPASVPDSMLEVPRNVQFQDMSEMMKGMQQKQG